MSPDSESLSLLFFLHEERTRQNAICASRLPDSDGELRDLAPVALSWALDVVAPPTLDATEAE